MKAEYCTTVTGKAKLLIRGGCVFVVVILRDLFMDSGFENKFNTRQAPLPADFERLL